VLERSNVVALHDEQPDDGLSWAGLHGGVEGERAENSQCLVKGKNSTRIAEGQELTVQFEIQFKAGFAGLKEVFARASDLEGNLVQWKRTGEWRVSLP
jgi:hypothetical protein